MATRKRRRYRHRRKRRYVSESSATYATYFDIDGTSPSNAGTTGLEVREFSSIINEGTTNRKVVRVRGIGSVSSSITNGSIALMIAMLAHPDLQEVPAVTDFDPFDSGPGIPGSTTYKGRPSPRPFGRHTTVLAVEGNNAQTLYHDFMVSSRAQRLIRPGWKLSCGIWSRSIATSVPYRLGMAMNVTVEG